ncbi:hypothetical protein ACFQ08_41955, partial [Streptosporangium algeriense]
MVTQASNLNIWHRPDLRSRETSKPHTHPWEVMEAHPVLGGYEDEHWHRTASGMLVQQGCVLNTPGTVNRVFARDYREAISIAAPGWTVSVMICGRWIHDETRRGVWGHPDPHTGDHVPVQRDPAEQGRFRSRLYRINPRHITANRTLPAPSRAPGGPAARPCPGGGLPAARPVPLLSALLATEARERGCSPQ